MYPVTEYHWFNVETGEQGTSAFTDCPLPDGFVSHYEALLRVNKWNRIDPARWVYWI